MLEARGIKNFDRIATLPGSAWEGEAIDSITAKAIAGKLTCLDDECAAPLQYVRASATARSHFRHRPGSTTTCTASSGEGEWHRWVTTDLFAAAYAHEHVIPGARLDAVVQRIGKKANLIAVEAQHSPIDPYTVLARHAAHRAAGVVGTLWLINAAHMDADQIISKAWVLDLLQACMDTALSPAGTPAFGCTVALLDTDGIRFIDTIEIIDGDRRYARVTKLTDAVGLDAVRWWAQDPARSAIVPEAFAEGIRRLDAAPTRRVKRFAERAASFKRAA